MPDKKPRTNIDGYNLVIETLAKDHSGPQLWLSEQLGVNRQTINNWRERGIPPGQVKIVARLTGLSEAEVAPEHAHLHIPGNLFDQIARSARAAGQSFSDHFVAVIRRGLRK
jgi:hypothetical protein